MREVSVDLVHSGRFVYKLPMFDDGRVKGLDLLRSKVHYLLMHVADYVALKVLDGGGGWDLCWVFTRLQWAVKRKDEIVAKYETRGQIRRAESGKVFVDPGVQVVESRKEQVNGGNGVEIKQGGEIGSDRGDVETSKGGEGVKDESGTLEEQKGDQNGQGQCGDGVKDESGTRDGQKDSENCDSRGEMNDTKTRRYEKDNENGDGSGEVDKRQMDGDERDKDSSETKNESSGEQVDDEKGGGSGSGEMDENEDLGDEKDEVNGDMREEIETTQHNVDDDNVSDEMDETKVEGDEKDKGSEDKSEGVETRKQMNDENGEGGGQIDESKACGEVNEDWFAPKSETRREHVNDENGEGGKCV
ncbi:hypothetical protein HDU76_010640 [Blyttiomyces sp. JEL0837]|nr:hypothetical protein HDU76_010640 [Blyttiomyces sp. JEL0837]